MPTLRIAWFALILAAACAAADFQKGLEAYNRGDFTAAMAEWRPLAEKGDANAQYNVGLLYARGQGVPEDFRQAAEWYRKAAEQGVAAAQYNLGVIHANGQGVPQNMVEATRWFTRAAEQGVGQAQDSLGSIYDEGQGAFKNFAEAEKWYRKAAAQGVASAAFSLGVMYDLGQGVQRNFDEALGWYRKAAGQGYAPACTNIGILYYNAQGVKRDLVESYAWFKRAEKAGDKRAGQLVRVVAGRLQPADLQKADALAANWKPANPNRPVEIGNLFLKPQPRGAGSADRVAAESPAPAKPAAPATIPAVWNGIERVVVVGDVHGDFEQFVLVLESAGLVDGAGDWTGGKTHLVQTGDLVDRGPDSRKVMDLLIKLESQAKAAGGAVHCLIGNHEAMNVYGDLRYVSPGEYASYSDNPLQAIAYGRTSPVTEEARPLAGPPPAAGHVPGMAELRAALSPTGRYGRWILGHNAAIKIDRTLFVHAGLGGKYAYWTLDQINQEVRRELAHPGALHGGIVTDEAGPLWFRGLARGDDQLLVDTLLKNFSVDRIVVGHTYAGGAVTPRMRGKVLLVDVGISRIYDNMGKVGCLLIENGKPYSLHRGQKLDLPRDDGADLLRYLRQAAALDPKPSPLTARIQELEGRVK